MASRIRAHRAALLTLSTTSSKESKGVFCMSQRESFSSKIGFFFSALGCAVGCGNLWRFPYMVGTHGGAVFLLIYLLIVAFIAYPLLSMEFALGRITQKDPVGAYRAIAPKKAWPIAGYMGLAVSFCFLCYLTPIFGWFVGYLFRFAVGFFNEMSPAEIAEYFTVYRTNGNVIAAQSLILLVVISLLLLKGVRKGLEATNNICMPLLLVILILLCIRSLTLPNIGPGLEFYLKPDFSKFTLASLVAALGQALFSVGIGIGCGIVFGSYLPRDGSSISKKATMVCIGDTIVAFLAGIMIFPSIFSFNLEPNAGAGLLFVTLPNVFNRMVFGNVIAIMTVLLFMLAMITSQIACLEALICFAQDHLHIARQKTLMILVPIIAVLIWLNAFSPKSFDTFDWFTSFVLLNGGALISSIFFGWVWGPDKALDAADIKNHRGLWAFLLKFLIPLAVACIFVTGFFM